MMQRERATKQRATPKMIRFFNKDKNEIGELTRRNSHKQMRQRIIEWVCGAGSGDARRRGRYSPQRRVERGRVGIERRGYERGFWVRDCMGEERGRENVWGEAKAAFLLWGADCAWGGNAACPATTLGRTVMLGTGNNWSGCGACFLDETPLPSLPFGPFLPFDEKMGARAHSGLRCLELACPVLAWCWC